MLFFVDKQQVDVVSNVLTVSRYENARHLEEAEKTVSLFPIVTIF